MDYNSIITEITNGAKNGTLSKSQLTSICSKIDDIQNSMIQSSTKELTIKESVTSTAQPSTVLNNNTIKIGRAHV